MAHSLIELQKVAILNAVQHVGIDPRAFQDGQPPPVNHTWRYVLLDSYTHRVVTNVLKIDHILDQNVSAVEEIENKRVPHPDFEAVYILSPRPHIVECLISEFKRPKPRYVGGHLLWTNKLPRDLQERLGRAVHESGRQNWILSENILAIDFFPRESHMFTFRDPKSFYPLYSPKCDDLCMPEFAALGKKILGVCVTLGEFPIIRYFRSPHLTHRARALPQMIAFQVQKELEGYKTEMNKRGIRWPAEDKSRPKGILFIVDRSMDPIAPLLHEFTYQAMAHDLLPIVEGEKVSYTTAIKDALGQVEKRELFIAEEDKVWQNVRHKHMKDTIGMLREDFEKFLKANPNFTKADASSSVFAIKDMLATLPQFAEQKDAYELHFTMSEEVMDIFAKHKLPDTADLEQNLATGLDSNNDKARGLTDQLVRLLAAPETLHYNDRLRLILLYLLWKDGLIGTDIEKLFRHAAVPMALRNALYNLDLIGVRTVKRLKEPLRPAYKKPVPSTIPVPDGYELSRYVPVVKTMLEDHTKGVLDVESYPYTESALNPNPSQNAMHDTAQQQASLRSTSANPTWTWTKSRLSAIEPRQRIIVFVAGGATYSEARACYEVSHATTRDVYLGSSHMVSPDTFLEQIASARADRRELHLEADIPEAQRPRAPAHLFEADNVPKPAPAKMATPAAASGGSRIPPASQSNGKSVHQPGSFNPLPDKDKKSKKRFLGLKG